MAKNNILPETPNKTYPEDIQEFIQKFSTLRNKYFISYFYYVVILQPFSFTFTFPWHLAFITIPFNLVILFLPYSCTAISYDAYPCYILLRKF